MNTYNKDLLIKLFIKTIIRGLIIGPIKDTQLKAHIRGPLYNIIRPTIKDTHYRALLETSLEAHYRSIIGL